MNASHALSTLAVLAGLAGLLLTGAPAVSQQDAGSRRADSSPAASEAADAEAAAAARRERLRRFRYGNLAEIELGGKQVMISYPDLAADSDDHRTFEALQAGEVSSWKSGKAIKLTAHTSLSFAGVVVPFGNASPNYPGVYSLWPKRTADGWSLVFNHDADIWGTQRDSAKDAAEVPLEHSRTDNPTDKLVVEFLEVSPGAVLRIAWGSHQFLAALERAK